MREGGLNFYKHYIGDFQRDTGHLSLTERGAYLCLIHHYYATEKPLPNDLDALCRIAGAVSRIERAAVKVVIGFFEPVASGLMSVRIEAELEKAGEISNTNRDIALAREAKRRAEKEARTEHEQSTVRAQSVPRTEHEQSTNQTPDTSTPLSDDKGVGDDGSSHLALSRRPKKLTVLPSDFYPNETGVSYAEDRRVALAVELESFRNWHQAKGTALRDWQAGWRTWCDKAVEFGRSGIRPAATARPINGRRQRTDELRETASTILTGRTTDDRQPATERDITADCQRIA